MRALPKGHATQVEELARLRTAKALKLLKDPNAAYDVDHAMVPARPPSRSALRRPAARTHAPLGRWAACVGRGVGSWQTAR